MSDSPPDRGEATSPAGAPPAERWAQALSVLADAERRVARPAPVAPAPAPAAVPAPAPATEGPTARARGICLDLLANRARTRSQLAAALARRGVEPEIAAEVLDGLGAAGLVDDAAFSTAWVQERQARRGLSRTALAVELRHRGVAEEDLQTAVSAVTDDAELAAARRLLSSRVAGLARLPRETALRRLRGLLERRGFGPATATRLALEALGADPTESES
jgi:regulatory protein